MFIHSGNLSELSLIEYSAIIKESTVHPALAVVAYYWKNGQPVFNVSGKTTYSEETY